MHPFCVRSLTRLKVYLNNKDSFSTQLTIVSGALETSAPLFCGRHPIGFRSPSNRIPFAAQSDQSRTSRFQMKDLPTEVARMVDTMKVGEVSAPFTMVNSKGKTTCALVKLVSRVDGHRATITEDFQVMKDVVLAKERAQTLHDWVVNKIKQTYVRMNDRYKDCKFEYQGWIK